jgi:hypothetical protein
MAGSETETSGTLRASPRCLQYSSLTLRLSVLGQPSFAATVISLSVARRFGRQQINLCLLRMQVASIEAMVGQCICQTLSAISSIVVDDISNRNRRANRGSRVGKKNRLQRA